MKADLQIKCYRQANGCGGRTDTAGRQHSVMEEIMQARNKQPWKTALISFDTRLEKSFEFSPSSSYKYSSAFYCHTYLPLPVSATKYDKSTNCAMLSRRVQLSSTAGWWGELAQSHKPPETVPLSNRSFLQLGHRSTAKCRGTCILCAVTASPDWDATIKVPTTLAPKTSPH